MVSIVHCALCEPPLWPLPCGFCCWLPCGVVHCVSPPSLRLGAVTDAPNGGSSPNCNGFQQFNVSGSSSISISDGSAKGMKYSNNSECYWSVSAPQGNRVELTFEYFDLEEGYDTLTVSLEYR